MVGEEAVVKLAIVLVAVFCIAVVMTMAGRGGGNFYVVAEVAAGASMHLAASTGQLIMFCTSLAAMFIFHKYRTVVWPMAVFIGLTTSVMAFVGGAVAGELAGMTLKLVFAAMLVLAGFIMLLPVAERRSENRSRPGWWHLESGGETYVINLWLAIPVALGTGLVAGMVGISGGSFLVPLMVLACGLPMRNAVGTASVMVAATAGMGFLGHLSAGNVDLAWALPQALVAAAGGIIGGKLAVRSKPKALKQLFAYSTLAAALFMFINALSR